jgi:uncharacterized membrane protein YfcA
MLASLPLHEIAPLAAALVAGGLLMGFLSGLLGIGGGGIVVPVLYELFRVTGMDDSIRMKVCVATSLAVIIPTSIRAASSHWGRGSMDFCVLRRLGPWFVLGATLGVVIAARSPAGLLKGVFVASTLFLAWHMAFGKNGAAAAEKLPGLPWDGLAGASIGLISALIGIGGGVYITSYLKLFGWPIHKAVGTASGFGPIIAIPGVLGYIVEGWGVPTGIPLSLGFVSFAAALVVAPLSVLAAPLGVRVAHMLSRRALEYVFIAFLLTVASRFIVSLLFHV